MTSSWLRLPLSLLIVVALLAPAEAARRKKKGKDRPELPGWAVEYVDAPVVEDFPKADAIIVLESWDLTVERGARKGTRRRVLRVVTEDGRDHADVVLFQGSFRKHQDVKLWVQDPEGGLELYSESDGSLFTAIRRKLLDDDSGWYIEPPGVRPGTVVILESSVEMSAELPQDQFSIHREIPVWKARVAVESRDDWTVYGRVVGGDNPGPDEATGSGAWVFERVPALKRVEADNAPVPPGLKMTLEVIPPQGEITFPDWSTTANWTAALFDAGDDMTAVRETAARLSDEEDPVDAVGELVRRMRYFGVEIGWGGWRPRTPATTLRRGFGDCKDKSFLMVSLLQQVGVEAVPVIVMAPDDGYVYEELPGPFQFNHCIVGIPLRPEDDREGIVWVDSPGVGPVRLFDPTLSEEFPGDVAPGLEGGRGLAVDARSTGLLQVPRTPGERNESVTHYDARLNGDGTLSISMQRRLSGGRAYQLWEAGSVMDSSELRRDIANEFAEDLPGLSDVSVSEPRLSEDGVWTFDASFAQPEALASYGDVTVLHLPILAAASNFPLPDIDEPETLYQWSLRRTRETWVVDLSGFDVLTLPESLDVERPMGRVSLSVERDDGRVTVRREIDITSIEIPPGQRDDALALRAALRSVNKVRLALRGP
ncbi:MAG: DUF3857 domain-containing protein [bacterium]|nr:DUF3857 domain-containing protein [bacterium]